MIPIDSDFRCVRRHNEGLPRRRGIGLSFQSPMARRYSNTPRDSAPVFRPTLDRIDRRMSMGWP
jgi:hypothetical protein